MNYLAILIGHDEKSSGATGYFPDGNMSEYRFHMDKIAPIIQSYGNNDRITTKIFTRNFGGVTAAYKNINEWGKGKNACAVELHFNSFNGQVQGTEVLFDLVPPSSEVLARLMQEKLCQAFARPSLSRGVKLTNEGRGAYNLRLCTIPSCLTEAFFGDNKGDANEAWARQNKYAYAIVDAANAFLNQIKTS